MQKLFNKILVPIDFSARSKKAIDKAVDIACEHKCSICLLHVAPITPFSALAMADGHLAVPFNVLDNKKELEFRLDKLRNYISLHSENRVESTFRIIQGGWNEVIIDFAEENNIDLILIGQDDYFQHKRKMMLNPDTIALKTNIPVITVPANRRLTRLFSIVIPITDFLPTRKLMYGVYIASSYDTVVKLLGIENEKTHSKMEYYLHRAVRLIRDNSDVKVDTEVIYCENVAEAVDRFTRKQHADLLILNPNTQTKMPGIFSSIMGNIIQKYSSPPVLTVTPV
ncbi:MAG: universal stress protein [Ferruginibacter sp.]